ncbi:MAG: cellulase family glycosylhydrolase [Thermoleophilaceae bacterium]
MLKTVCAALTAATALLVLPAAAFADPDAEVAIMDDQLILTHKQVRVDGAMTVFGQLGVDRVRVSAYWRDIAPSPRSTRKPRRFDSMDHTERRYDWDNLDRVVDSANAHGLKLLISITTPGPVWASESPRRKNPVWKPKPVEFARFAQALATRYADRVDMYALMNEPNQGAWLQPQRVGNRLYSPYHYRRMVNGAYSRVKEADPTSTVIIGELAPTGGRGGDGTTRPMRPLTFLRELGCVNSRLNPTRRGYCRDFEAPAGDMFGTHPYQVRGKPSLRSRNRDDAAIADHERVFGVLDSLTSQGRILSMQKPLMDIYYTEFGYQTDPPDPHEGISRKRQDDYLQEAAFMTWQQPRVRGNTQFRLTDGELRRGERGRARYFEIQSGLLSSRGRPKPSYYNFFDPFWIENTRPRAGEPVLFWGQVRPGGSQSYVLEYRPRRGEPWVAQFDSMTNEAGYFTSQFAPASGEYRFRWNEGVSATRSVRVRD